ncbi:RNA-binding domain-containing protein [Aureobasidium pullulans]|nr:RNA-binding domain-containing protein [Aureobasidium pullulans]
MDHQQTSEQSLPSKRIYIGNLPYAAQAEDVEQYLEEAGFQIERLDMATDPFTGRNPSYCFAELFSVEEAERAISSLPGASFMGRPLRVNVHTPKTRGANGTSTPLRTSTRSPFSAERSWRGTPSASNGAETPSKTGERDSYVFNRWERNDASSHWTAPLENGRRLYVGGLPRMDGQETVQEEMKALFSDYPIEAVSKIISPHESTASLPGDHHYCFVDFSTTEDAQAAAKAVNGATTSTGSKLKVNMARERSNRKVVVEQGLEQRSEQKPEQKPAPVRDFSSSWRRAN